MTEAEIKEEFDSLNPLYEKYIRELQAKWYRKNPFRSDKVIEIWDAHDRERANSYTADWAYYVTPFAEAWWKERGYGIIWPDDDSQPVAFYKLENVPKDTANGN
jgi:hypothetical protein